MAKKVVASQKRGDAQVYVKAIKMIKSPKTGAYSFKEDILPQEDVKNFFAKK